MDPLLRDGTGTLQILTPFQQATSEFPLASDREFTSENYIEKRKLTLSSSDGPPSLALRPIHPNINLLSPTPSHKGQRSRLYNGKENDVFAFNREPTPNPYLASLSPHEGNSLNPLCVQSRDGAGFRPFSPYDDDAKPITNGFQPINAHNGHNGYSSLHFPSRNTSTAFQPDRHHDNFDI